MQPSNTPEEWRPVVGYEGHYEVSDHGNVRSVDRYVSRPDGGTRFYAGTTMLLNRHRNQRWQVSLSMNGRHQQRSVHRLVLEAFVGPCPEGMEGCHWDDDPDNNHVSNLRWGTRADNMQDKIRNGNNHNVNKTHCPQGHKFTPENTYVGKQAQGRTYRQCRACDRARYHERRRYRHVLGQEDRHVDQ